jgi:LysR family hydrogen peroxide-inducible transcriptional activator
LIAACNESGVNERGIRRRSICDTIIAMVSAGIGVSAVPAMAVQPVPACRFIRIADKNGKRKIGVIRLRHHFEARAQTGFGQSHPDYVRPQLIIHGVAN